MYSIPAHDIIRLRHMLEAATKAQAFVQGHTRTDLESDELLALALVRLLEILGEAATRVSPEVQAHLPGIPWRQMAGTRNRLIHGYFNVDLDIVWAIIHDDLPGCIETLATVVRPVGDEQ